MSRLGSGRLGHGQVRNTAKSVVEYGCVAVDLSLFPAALSLVSVEGIRRKALWGPMFGIFASATWVLYGYATAQWGIVLSEVVFAVMYAATVVEWAGIES